MFNVFLFVCLDGLPGGKRSGASESSETKENGCFYHFSGLRRSETSCNGSRQPVLGAEGLILLIQNRPPEGSFSSG